MLKKFLSIFALPLLLFCTYLVLVFFGFHLRYPWIDIPSHFLGGVFIANSFSMGLTYFQQRKLLSEMNELSRSIFLFALTSTATIIWEFGEFILDFFFRTKAQAGLEDTMLDMFLGMLGGTCIIIFLARRSIKESK